MEPSSPGIARHMKEALLWALLAFVLALPLIGVETFPAITTLGLRPRFGAVAIVVAVVFAARLLLVGLTALRKRRIATLIEKPVRPLAGLASPRVARIVGLLFLAVAIVLPFLPLDNRRYLIDTATVLLIYVMLGWGLNVVVGLAGLLDLGYVAFYAVGAYCYALVARAFGLGFWECLPLSGALAALFGVLLGFPVLRLRGDYLAIVTLGFGEIIRIILVNWASLTGGPNGISGIPRPSFFGLPLTPTGGFADFFGIAYSPDQRVIYLYFVILALALGTNLLVRRLRRLPIGRAWEALREDEIACRSLGINPTLVKLSAFGTGAMLGGFAGAFFATRASFISPESFTFSESASILAIVVLGGMGSQLGVVLAASFLVLLGELGREFAQYRMVIFGACMILIMIWRPQGLIAHREPSVRLKADAAQS
jgi:branched-chain amino acid transport system permease protein